VKAGEAAEGGPEGETAEGGLEEEAAEETPGGVLVGLSKE